MDQSTQKVVRRSLLGTLVFAGIAAVFAGPTSASSDAHVVPPFAASATATKPAGDTEVAVLAGGCFWGVQGVFQHVKGVSSAVSGYAGGEKKTAEYEMVGTGSTGHAESVQITFDPRQISYARILQIYFSVVHDPTQVNRQGPDSGTQYRSAIFPTNDEQARIARDYIAQITRAGVFSTPIATRIEPGKSFYPAEAYHQDFLTLNPHYPYIVINDLPKIDDLKKMYPDLYRAEPVLVKARKAGQSL